MESIGHLQKERDRYAEQIQVEGRVWKEKTEQLLTQVDCTLTSAESLVLASSEAKRIISVSVQVALVAEERDQNISRVQELEAAITELKSAAGKTFKWSC